MHSVSIQEHVSTLKGSETTVSSGLLGRVSMDSNTVKSLSSPKHKRKKSAKNFGSMSKNKATRAMRMSHSKSSKIKKRETLALLKVIGSKSKNPFLTSALSRKTNQRKQSAKTKSSAFKKRSSSKKQLDSIRFRKMDISFSPLLCTGCNGTWDDEQNYLKHIKSCPALFICKICNIKMPEREKLDEHLKSHEAKQQNVNMCNKNKSSMSLHKSILCDICSKSFAEEKMMQLHKIHLHLQKCTFCRKDFYPEATQVGEALPYQTVSCNNCRRNQPGVSFLSKLHDPTVSSSNAPSNVNSEAHCASKTLQQEQNSKVMSLKVEQNLKNSFSCVLCKKLFSEKHLLVSHCLQHHTHQNPSEYLEVTSSYNEVVEIDENNPSNEPEQLNVGVSPMSLNTVEIGGNKLHFCSICNAYFFSEEDFFTHCDKLHPGNFLKEETKDFIVVDGLFRCNICEKVFNSNFVLQDHLKSHKLDGRFDNQADSENLISPPSRSLQCGLCCRMFHNIDLLNVHVKSYHHVDVPFFIQVNSDLTLQSDISFYSTSIVNKFNPILSSSPVRSLESFQYAPMEVSTCHTKQSLNFASFQDASVHHKNRGDPKLLPSSSTAENINLSSSKIDSENIGISTNNVDDSRIESAIFSSHKKQSENIPKKKAKINPKSTFQRNKIQYKCYICGHQLLTSEAFKCHIKEKHPDKDITPSPSELLQQAEENPENNISIGSNIKKINISEDEILCEFCEKILKKKSLVPHKKRMHADMLNSKKQINTLKINIQSNSSEHVCNVCEKSCGNRGALISHEKIHNLKNMFVCKNCKETFKLKSVFRRHKLKCLAKDGLSSSSVELTVKKTPMHPTRALLLDHTASKKKVVSLKVENTNVETSKRQKRKSTETSGDKKRKTVNALNGQNHDSTKSSGEKSSKTTETPVTRMRKVKFVVKQKGNSMETTRKQKTQDISDKQKVNTVELKNIVIDVSDKVKHSSVTSHDETNSTETLHDQTNSSDSLHFQETDVNKDTNINLKTSSKRARLTLEIHGKASQPEKTSSSKIVSSRQEKFRSKPKQMKPHSALTVTKAAGGKRISNVTLNIQKPVGFKVPKKKVKSSNLNTKRSSNPFLNLIKHQVTSKDRKSSSLSKAKQTGKSSISPEKSPFLECAQGIKSPFQNEESQKPVVIKSYSTARTPKCSTDVQKQLPVVIKCYSTAGTPKCSTDVQKQLPVVIKSYSTARTPKCGTDVEKRLLLNSPGVNQTPIPNTGMDYTMPKLNEQQNYKEANYKCDICSSTFCELHMLIFHKREDHNIIGWDTVLEETSAKLDISSTSKANNVNQNTPKPVTSRCDIECELCHKILRSTGGFVTHMTKDHKIIKPVTELLLYGQTHTILRNSKKPNSKDKN